MHSIHLSQNIQGRRNRFSVERKRESIPSILPWFLNANSLLPLHLKCICTYLFLLMLCKPCLILSCQFSFAKHLRNVLLPILRSASMFETIQDKRPWTDSPVPFKRRIPQLTVHAKSSFHKKFNQILKKEQ